MPAGPLNTRQMTQQVAAYAREDEEFSRLWEARVSAAADRLTAQIAGARMAGELHGMIAWDSPDVPLPDVLDAGTVRYVFSAAVYAEVMKRLNVMQGPGAFG